MSDQNPDQDWLARALQNMNQPPLLPATRDESTTDRNPFCRSTRGTYGLRQTHGQAGRTLAQTQTPTILPSLAGLGRRSNRSSTYIRDPVPSYETTDPRALPRARPRPLRPEERNSIPFPTMTRQRRPVGATSATVAQPRESDRWPLEDSDTNTDTDEPGPSQRRRRLPNPASKPDSLADPELLEESPFNLRGCDYEWNQLEQIDRDILGPYAVEA
ncbi:hypothetical protein ARMGADRAFT_1040617 [Armillaria gallica]|uniref:Uncharacterized protein n=1 Tax=Armillaria gallica TaxID=47427 RepID=A0A2H3CEA1_ARMGA|nr:hypothetical protein ARMGADRAFT_1040617 [Armillaria gallica]